MKNLRKPWGFFTEKFEDFDDLFGLFGSAMLRTSLKEETDKYTITAEVPGLTKDDISVVFEDEHLDVSATWKEDADSLRSGKHGKSYFLPDVEGTVDASIKDGVLTVIAQRKPQVPPRKVEIKIS